MRRLSSSLATTPIAWPVLMSLLIGLVNFADTVVRVLFFDSRGIVYPLGVALKPLLFLGQAISALVFFLGVAFYPQWLRLVNGVRWSFLIQSIVVLMVAVLFSLGLWGSVAYSEALSPYGQGLWFASYLLVPLVAFWGASSARLRKPYRRLAPVFVLVGAALVVRSLDNIFFLVQNVYGFSLPPAVDTVALVGAPFLLWSAVAYSWFWSRAVEPGPFSTRLLRDRFLYAALVLGILPLLWNGVAGGVMNFIIRLVFYWGLGYSGYGPYSVSVFLSGASLYLALLATLSRSVWKGGLNLLVLLGFASFPWNGIFDGSLAASTSALWAFSSIPGNLLSLNAVIAGLFFYQKEGKLEDGVQLRA